MSDRTCLDMTKKQDGWGLLWYSSNQLNGVDQHLMWHGGKPLFFDTRREARAYHKVKYGYLRTRPDLQREPFGWTVPKVVKVVLTTNIKLAEMPE